LTHHCVLRLAYSSGHKHVRYGIASLLRHQKNKHRVDLHWTVPLTDGACRIGLRRWPAVIIKTNQFRKTLGRTHNTSVHFASADKKRRPVTTSNFSRPVHTHRPKARRRQAQHWISCMSADVADSSSSNASQHAVLHSSRLLHTNVSMRVQPSLNHMAQKLHTDGTAWRTRKRGKSKRGSMIQDGTVSHTPTDTDARPLDHRHQQKHRCQLHSATAPRSNRTDSATEMFAQGHHTTHLMCPLNVPLVGRRAGARPAADRGHLCRDGRRRGGHTSDQRQSHDRHQESAHGRRHRRVERADVKRAAL